MLLKLSQTKLLCILLFCLISTLSYADIKLKFGLYNSERPSDLIKKFRPILNVLEQRLKQTLDQNVSIKIIIAPSYEQGNNQLINGKVDFMRMGPASYIFAHKRNPKISILAAESNKGKKIFKGIICVKKSGSIKTIQDLKGKRFAFGNKRSTIGRYLSQRYLVQAGIHAKDLSQFKYFTSHDKVAAIVGLEIFDAGALKFSTFKKYNKKGASLRKLAEFTNVTKPWVAREDLDKTVQLALKNALLQLNDKHALKKLKKDGFLPAENSDYDSIRIAIDDNKKFFK